MLLFLDCAMEKCLCLSRTQRGGEREKEEEEVEYSHKTWPVVRCYRVIYSGRWLPRKLVEVSDRVDVESPGEEEEGEVL